MRFAFLAWGGKQMMQLCSKSDDVPNPALDKPCGVQAERKSGQDCAHGDSAGPPHGHGSSVRPCLYRNTLENHDTLPCPWPVLNRNALAIIPSSSSELYAWKIKTGWWSLAQKRFSWSLQKPGSFQPGGIPFQFATMPCGT